MKKHLFLLVSLFGLASCSQEPKALLLDNAQAYVTSAKEADPLSTSKQSEHDERLFLKYAPCFVVENDDLAFNRIGQPSLQRMERKKLHAYVDPSSPNIYVMKRQFTTSSGTYTNLIYRVHFQEVPFGLLPFQITTGKNVGLLIFVTLNEKEEPVLLTSVHTCGCYTTIIPTNFLPKSAYPDDWKDEYRYRYGEKYPPILYYPTLFTSHYHPVYYLRSSTHRVADVFIEKVHNLEKKFTLKTMHMEPMQKLDHLPIEGETDTGSFFYTDGLNKGFVRSDFKPFEFMIMSWISLDPNIGVDKRYAPSSELKTRFYTSLNPFHRSESDLWDFDSFLEFWGWHL